MFGFHCIVVFKRRVASPNSQREEKVMRRLILVLMAIGLFGAMPAFAAEHEGMKMNSSDSVRECALQAESIQEKIKRLDTEIAKGEKKYSAKELKKLKAKLDDASKILDQLNKQ
jgi:septal ring factor EnvC (AmiA/AmiB activator)